MLTLIRLGFFFGDNGLITENLPKAEKCVPHILSHELEFITCRFIEEGGDWDRRNRLKVYRGLHLISVRQFKTGGELLLDALSTFTATELIAYNDFVALAIIINALTLKRVDLKKRVCRFP